MPAQTPTAPGIFIPSINRTVSVAAYCRAVRLAATNPDATFPYGLTTWWPTTGAQILHQFRQVRNERITAARRITR